MHNIVVSNLSYSKKGTHILKDINITMESGRIYGLLGHPDSGKSTLLSLIDGYTLPSSGSVMVNGEAPYENRSILEQIEFQFPKGYVFEARQAIHHFELLKSYNAAFDVEYALSLLGEYGIKKTQMISALNRNLSAAIDAITALASMKPIVFLDGIHHHMTIRTREIFYRHINEAKAVDRLIVIASEEASEIEHLIDDVSILHEGALIIHEDVEKILKRGFRVTGTLNNVLQIARGKTVVHEEQHGEIKSVIMLGALTQADDDYIARHQVYYVPIRVQELFEHMTGGSVRSED